MIRTLACIFVALVSARASAADVSPNGFLVRTELTIAAPASKVYDALTRQVGAWWNPQHTYSGDSANLSIDLRNSGASCAGQISFVPKPDPRAWNLAFWLHPQHWGHGVALEAVSRAIEGVFEAPMCAVLHAGVARWNHASMRTIARLGFSHTGDNPAGYFVAAAPEPVHEYELTLEQWHAARQETR